MEDEALFTELWCWRLRWARAIELAGSLAKGHSRPVARHLLRDADTSEEIAGVVYGQIGARLLTAAMWLFPADERVGRDSRDAASKISRVAEERASLRPKLRTIARQLASPATRRRAYRHSGAFAGAAHGPSPGPGAWRECRRRSHWSDQPGEIGVASTTRGAAHRVAEETIVDSDRHRRARRVEEYAKTVATDRLQLAPTHAAFGCEVAGSAAGVGFALVEAQVDQVGGGRSIYALTDCWTILGAILPGNHEPERSGHQASGAEPEWSEPR